MVARSNPNAWRPLVFAAFALLVALFPRTPARADATCLSTHREALTLLQNLRRYDSATPSAARTAKWKKLHEAFGKFINEKAPDTCDKATYWARTAVIAYYAVLAIRNGTVSAESPILNLTLNSLYEAAEGVDKVPGFDATLFRSLVVRMLETYRTNHINLTLSNDEQETFHRYLPDIDFSN
jgi:hypothetical protein